MSKITFRADDDLVAQLEEFDASKSEVMREALRTYLESPDRASSAGESSGTDPESTSQSTSMDPEESLDALIEERVDAVLADRFGSVGRSEPQDINVTVSLEDALETNERATTERAPAREGETTPPHEGPDAEQERTCSKCGEAVSTDHVYCPNCGEKASHRVFCECGDELRSDWGFCPSCGRRTAAADVLDQ